MKYTITIILFTIFATISSQSNAEETTYGVGVGVNDGIKLYFPINVSNLIIEPTFFMFSRDNQSSGSSSQSNDDYRIMELGVGVFKNKEILESTYTYYGGRIGYIDSKDNYTFISSSSISSSSSDEDGYFIAPTLGVQYYWTPKFSIGLDVAFMYSKTDGTTTRESSFSATTISDTESTDYNTESEVIIRYKF